MVDGSVLHCTRVNRLSSKFACRVTSKFRTLFQSCGLHRKVPHREGLLSRRQYGATSSGNRKRNTATLAICDVLSSGRSGHGSREASTAHEAQTYMDLLL